MKNMTISILAVLVFADMAIAGPEPVQIEAPNISSQARELKAPLKAPPLKKLSINKVEGIVVSKNCVDGEFQVALKNTCAEKRVILDMDSDAEKYEECNKVGGVMDSAVFTLKESVALNSNPVIANSVEPLARNSGDGTLLDINRIDKEAKFKLEACGHDTLVRIMFSNYDLFDRQLGSIENGQKVKVEGEFKREPAEGNREYSYYVFDPTVNLIDAGG